MNETERKALVDSIHAELETVYGMRWGVDSMGVVMTIMPIIDRLLAAADAPGLDLDALLASVDGGNMELSHYFGLWKCVMFATVGNVREQVVGHGNSPMDAIRNAVAQATATTQEGTSDE